MTSRRKYTQTFRYKIRKVYEREDSSSYAVTVPEWIIRKYGEEVRFSWEEYGDGYLVLKSGAISHPKCGAIVNSHENITYV